MQKPDYHILVCASFRTSGAPQGVCHKKGAIDLLQYLNEGLNDRGIAAMVSTTGCMKVCDRGPAMVVYSGSGQTAGGESGGGGQWYGPMDEDGIDEVLDALESGAVAQGRLMT